MDLASNSTANRHKRGLNFGLEEVIQGVLAEHLPSTVRNVERCLRDFRNSRVNKWGGNARAATEAIEGLDQIQQDYGLAEGPVAGR